MMRRGPIPFRAGHLPLFSELFLIRRGVLTVDQREEILAAFFSVNVTYRAIGI